MRIEWIGIEPGVICAFQPFTQLKIENAEAQPARGLSVLRAVGKPQAIAADFGMNAWPDVLERRCK